MPNGDRSPPGQFAHLPARHLTLSNSDYLIARIQNYHLIPRTNLGIRLLHSYGKDIASNRLESPLC